MASKDERKSTDAKAVDAKQFSQMDFGEKIVHIGKVIVFFLSFGFAFPNIFSD